MKGKNEIVELKLTSQDKITLRLGLARIIAEKELEVRNLLYSKENLYVSDKEVKELKDTQKELLTLNYVKNILSKGSDSQWTNYKKKSQK